MSNTARDTRKDTVDFSRTTSHVVDSAVEMAEKAGATFETAKARTAEAASDAVEKGRAASQQLEAVAGNFKGAIDKSVKDQPMAMLAAVAAVGFVLGALWRS